MKRMLPISFSRIQKINGWSAVKNCLVGADPQRIVTAVAADASVQS